VDAKNQEVDMVRGLLTLALLALTSGCGKEQEATELKTYITTIKQLDSYSRRVQAEILRFDDPTQEITNADIVAAFDLLVEYQKAVADVTPPETSTGGNTHDLFVRSFDEAMGLASDEKGNTKRRAHSAAIGLRNLRKKLKDRVYPTFNLLMTRLKMTGEENELSWPE
jgi:hypothetical protein